MKAGLRLFLVTIGISAIFGSFHAVAQPTPAGAALATPAMPTISPLGTSAAPYGPITMTDSTPGARIYYEINGGSPTLYTGPFSISTTETVQAIAVNLGQGTYTQSGVNTQNFTVSGGTAPTWSRLATLPSLFNSQGGTMVNVGNGNLFGVTFSGRSPQVVVSVYVAPQSNLASWKDISSASLSQNGTEYESAMGQTPNGTILMAQTNFSTLADVFFWNGSTSAPVWTKITGWNGVSSSSIYNFTNDSAGYTYFSPAWSGDIWRNDAPNSTNFTKIYTNLYQLTGSNTYGGLYQTWVWNLGDGKGDTLWTCGEGVLMNVDLAFSKVTQYLNTPGSKGNCFGLGKSPTNILALRTADAAGDTVNQISIATRNTTVVPSGSIGAGSHYPPYVNTNLVNGLEWMNGKNWMMSNSASSSNFLLLSPDDGNTWTDITASGAIDSSCKGTNLSAGATVTPHYIIARCQNGHAFWQYGPI